MTTTTDYTKQRKYVWYDVITEEMWEILKKFKNATIDFKLLRGQVTNATK